MKTKMTDWARAAGRVVAWLAGSTAGDVWPTYQTFEEDMSILFDTVEDVYGSVKWLLEERERRNENRRNATSQADASGIVTVTAPSALDDEGSEKVEP